jgi:type VI secretion system protein ImpG
MDPRLIGYYEQELQHLQDMGREFAEQFPKQAARLRLGKDVEVADPYVERLLEGFAFLAARVQLKLDAEFPRFTQHLVEILYPQFLAPLPAMLIAQAQPDPGDAGLLSGVTLPRGSMLRAQSPRAGLTDCRFRTAHELVMWPLELASAEYFTHATNLPLNGQDGWRKFAAGVRIRLRTTGGADFRQIALQDLRLHCAAGGELAYALHELVCGHTLGAVVSAGGRHEALQPGCVRTVGFEDDQALLPVSPRGFGGYRLLQEYFAFPSRFLFFDLAGLGDALRRLGGQEAEIVLLFSRANGALAQSVDAGSLALNCVPAINLFEQRCDRVQVGPQGRDHHVVVDRARPMDFEIIDLLEVTGHGGELSRERRFAPLYAAFHHDDEERGAYYTMQREPRLLSARQKDLRGSGPRSSYIGSEVFVSIVDTREAPYSADLQQLGVRALCSNRDLPLLMSTGSDNDLTLEGSAPVKGIRVVKGPSRPQSALRESNLTWRFINQLSLNHLSLSDTDEHQGAAALREMLRLYAREGDEAAQRQIDGLRSVRTEPVVRRLPKPGPIAFGRGVQISLTVDELAFQGGSAFLLGCVLERYFGRHVSMNGFTELRLSAPSRGLIFAGRPQDGSRPLL